MAVSGKSLSLQKISVAFGGLKAVTDFSLELNPGEICGLIGPNGAGKTTVFNLITGIYPSDTGTMTLGNEALSGLPPYKISQFGIARTFQNIRLFSDLSVLSNVLVAFHPKVKYGYFASIFRTSKFVTEEALLIDQATKLLELMGLNKFAQMQAKNLSYGDQRRLEIARALAAQPQVLLLDEPAAGLNSQEKVELMKLVSRIRGEFGVSILVIEHDMKLIMGICERIVVLDHGETIAAGTPREIQANPRVIEAYLGVA